MLRKSDSHNPNYLAKVVKLTNLRKHSNADKLQIATIDFQNVITGLDAKEGDIYIYFPLECAINKEFLSWSNSFEDKTLNADAEQKGFFNKHGRVRAVKLRGEPSQGYIVPQKVFIEWLQTKVDNTHFNTLEGSEGIEFDSWGDLLICQKYVPRANTRGERTIKSKTPKESRIIEGQFKLHVDTENLRKNIDRINPEDYIGIHYKKHGTSFVVGNVKVKRKLNWLEKSLKFLGVKIDEEEYDVIYSSRKVIKNADADKTQNHYYSVDIWGVVKEELQDKIPKGFTLYGEILGYLSDNSMIQKGYDYGCKPGEHKTYIYRITFTNEDGLSYELDDLQIREFCNHYQLNYADTFFFYGQAKQFTPVGIDSIEDWRTLFLQKLEKEYNEKDCYMCINKVPEEGIVVRINNLFKYDAYKLKSFRFFELETKQLDQEVVDIESEQS